MAKDFSLVLARSLMKAAGPVSEELIIAGTKDIAEYQQKCIDEVCRDKDAYIEHLKNEDAYWQGVAERLGYPSICEALEELSDIKAERDQLRAKLDEANEIIAALLDIKHGDEKEKVRAFLASTPAFDTAAAAEDMRKTAQELRDNADGDPGAIQQALMWEEKAEALSPAPQPEQKAQVIFTEFEGEAT